MAVYVASYVLHVLALFPMKMLKEVWYCQKHYKVQYIKLKHFKQMYK